MRLALTRARLRSAQATRTARAFLFLARHAGINWADAARALLLLVAWATVVVVGGWWLLTHLPEHLQGLSWLSVIGSTKVYTVVIDGEEYVSQAAQEAGDGLDRFTSKKGKWIKSFVDIKAAWEVLVTVGRAVWNIARDSFEAFDEYSNSLRKLQGTAKLTGTPLGELHDLAANAKTEFALSSVQANEFATAVNMLSIKSGGAVDKQKLLASVLELGAAKGLDAAASLTAFNQSILGIDEGTDKLFGKNPSGLWADYADAIGKSPGKMNDLDKSLVLVMATMDAGNKVQGSFATWLESSQGQSALFSNRLQDMKIAFAEVLVPVRDVVVKGLNTFADSLGTGGTALQDLGRVLTLFVKNQLASALVAWETFGPTVVAILKGTLAGVLLLSDGMRTLAIATQKGVGETVKYLGLLVEKGGKILSVFGIEMVEGWGSTMREWGDTTSRAATTSWAVFRKESREGWESIGKDVERGAPKVEQALEQTASVAGAAFSDIATTSTRAAETVLKNFGPSMRDLIGITTGSLKQMGDTASESLDPTKAQQFNEKMQVLVDRSHAVRDQVMGWGPATEDAKDSAAEMASELASIARAGLDTATAFGVIDTSAASAMQSMINVGESLAKVIGGDFSSIGGVVAGVGSIVKVLTGGDTERKKLLRDNTTGLNRLTKEVGNLRIGVTGDTFVKVGDALADIVPKLKPSTAVNGAQNLSTLIQGLQAQGLTINDLEEVGKALGISLRDSKGGFSFTAIGQLLEAIGLTEFGQFGTGFGDRLDSTTRGFDINGTSAFGQIQKLFGLGAEFSPGLAGVFDPNDLAGTRGRLGELFQGLVDGTLDPSQFGGLTGTQFLDFITDMIGRIDDVLENPVPAAGDVPPASVPPGETYVPGVGNVPVPSATAMADAMTAYLPKATAFFADSLEVMTRTAMATEDTADNTAAALPWLMEIARGVSGGALVERMDGAIEQQRYALAVEQGRRGTF